MCNNYRATSICPILFCFLFSFVLIELKDFVLKGKALGEKL